jgi:hypothetical protein
MDDDVLDTTPEERDLLLRLAALPREAEPAHDLWPGIWSGIGARLAPDAPTALPTRPRRRRFLLQAAAAVLLFTGGVLVGHQWPSQSEPPARPARDFLAPAVDVQRTGTEYVAALRTLAERRGNPAAQAQGREAGLSVLYGAAHELVRLSPNDARVHQILRTVSTTRSIRTVRF